MYRASGIVFPGILLKFSDAGPDDSDPR